MRKETLKAVSEFWDPSKLCICGYELQNRKTPTPRLATGRRTNGSDPNSTVKTENLADTGTTTHGKLEGACGLNAIRSNAC